MYGGMLLALIKTNQITSLEKSYKIFVKNHQILGKTANNILFRNIGLKIKCRNISALDQMLQSL